VKVQYEKTIRELEADIKQLKEDALDENTRKQRKGRGYNVSSVVKVRDLKLSGSKGALDSFTKGLASVDTQMFQEQTKEVKELRKKLEQEEDAHEKNTKKFAKEVNDLQEKLKDLQLVKDRNEKKYQKYEEESKRATSMLDKETKNKWETEQGKVRLEKELRDCQKLLKDVQTELSRTKEESVKIQNRSKTIESENKDAASQIIKLEKDLDKFRRQTEDEKEKQMLKDKRRIQTLETDLEDWKKKTSKTETSESSLVIEK